MEIEQFQDIIWSHYGEHGRSFPWRDTDDPYAITVSELMLQQTQTSRVVPKYDAFLQEAPDWRSLASLPTPKILELWQGLGYNRRALYLQQTARLVETQYGGRLPEDPREIQKLPGFGVATAAAIAAFAYNLPVVFIETNIRRVYIHHYFQNKPEVHDREILPLVESTLDTSNPRHWYYALMDYGAMLKISEGNPNRRSKHYVRQSAFEGSDRQLRGAVLRYLLEKRVGGLKEMSAALQTNPDRLITIIIRMEGERFLRREGEMVCLVES